jgi:multiple sugar transport system permease protein
MKSSSNNQIRYLKRNYQGYLLMIPYLAVFIIFTVYPVITSVVLSFTTYNVFQSPIFIGFDNYVQLFFTDSIFPTAMQNTFLIAIVVGPLSYFLSLFLAWMVNEFENPWRTLLTVIFYAPTLSNSVFTIWMIVFDGDIYGFLNSFLLKLGFIEDPIQWRTNPQYMMMVVIVVQLWVSLGTSFLTLRAGFNTVDRQYYEAAAIDGIKNRFQELWFITLPMMAPHLMLSAVLAITNTFTSANVATVMTGFPSVNYATHTIMHHLQDYGTIRYERGYASAIATVLFLFSLLSNKFAQKLISRIGK